MKLRNLHTRATTAEPDVASDWVELEDDDGTRWRFVSAQGGGLNVRLVESKNGQTAMAVHPNVTNSITIKPTG